MRLLSHFETKVKCLLEIFSSERTRALIKSKSDQLPLSGDLGQSFFSAT